MDAGDQSLVRALSENEVCADCATRQPQWASVTYGSLHCLECSGAHRGLGVHLSFVRSMTMDSWTEKQVRMMKEGGNGQLKAWWREHGLPSNASVSQKYGSPAAALYKARLVAKVEGKPLPTELPKATGMAVSTVYDSGGGSGMSAGGFGGGNNNRGDKKGSEPIAGETEAAYVQRQRALQEEARARMRAKFGGGGLGGVGSDRSYNPRTGGYGGAGDAVEVISGGIKKLGSSAVDVVGNLRDAEALQKTKDTVKDLWGATLRGVSSFQQGEGDDNNGNGWSSLRTFGASLGAKVGEVAKNLAAPDDAGAFGDIIQARRNELGGSGKKMEGLGSSSSSYNNNDDGIDDLLRSREANSSNTYTYDRPPPPAPLAMSRSTSSNNSLSSKKKKDEQPQRDFFESFGV